MEALYLLKIFNTEFPPDLHVLTSSKSKYTREEDEFFNYYILKMKTEKSTIFYN